MTKKTFAHTMLWIAAVPLIAFMAWRTIMLVNLSLPGDAWYFGIAAVGAIEMGVFVWAMLYRWYALDNPAQRVICILMMFVSMLGSVTAFFTETFIQASRNGNSAKVDAALITIAIWVVSSVIALNAIAGVLFFVLEITEHAPKQPDMQYRIKDVTPEQPSQIGTQKEISTSHQLPPIDRERYKDFFTLTALRQPVRLRKTNKK